MEKNGKGKILTVGQESTKDTKGNLRNKIKKKYTKNFSNWVLALIILGGHLEFSTCYFKYLLC